jgi:uncharacterized membrane protein YuzA (DUF378 family)
MMMKKCMCTPTKIGGFLLIVGGLNWGLVGVGMLMGKMMTWNVVTMLLGKWPMVEAIVYVLVGIGAIMAIFGCKCAKCKACMAGGAQQM